jgi:hypothetical protein
MSLLSRFAGWCAVRVTGKSGILARSEQLYRGSGVVTKERALEIALDHLTDGLRRRLEAFEGWPGGVDQQIALLRHLPAALRNPAAPDVGELRASDDELQPATEASPSRVWRVLVRSNGGHVGSDHYVIVDADTGRVLRDMNWGE